MSWLEQPFIKWALPLPLLAALAPVIWLFFRSTWRALDAEALAWRRDLVARGEVDYRPLVALTLVALILTWQEFYGRPDFYGRVVHDLLDRRWRAHPDGLVNMPLYDDLYARSWWAVTRIGGYLIPFAVWPLFFRGDKFVDFGLRTQGFRVHAWIYALCVVVMVPVLLVVSSQPDFVAYYPMYKLAGRSWLDFLLWESVYLLQFFTLELFFRGFMLRVMRGFGAGAIWAMVIPYCMVHYGKPYLEVCAAIVAGAVLGSLAMRTRSIYAGFLVHGTVAILMDVLSLDRRNFLPAALTPGSSVRVTFTHWRSLIWIAWALALAVLALKVWRSRAEISAALRKLRTKEPPIPVGEAEPGA